MLGKEQREEVPSYGARGKLKHLNIFMLRMNCEIIRGIKYLENKQIKKEKATA